VAKNLGSNSHALGRALKLNEQGLDLTDMEIYKKEDKEMRVLHKFKKLN